MTKQEQFFYDHAGFSYDPKTETREQGREICAKSLAKAETWAAQQGYSFESHWDNDPDLSWMTPKDRKKPHDVICILMLDTDGNTVQSLGGIVDADLDYMRVVKAELALEEMPDD